MSVEDEGIVTMQNSEHGLSTNGGNKNAEGEMASANIELSEEDAEGVTDVEELKILDDLRKSRRKIREPIWLKYYYKGKSGRRH